MTMFGPENFGLPLEKQLRLRVINNEIDECKDVDALQEQLKHCTKLLMTYQHLLSEILHKQIMADLEAMAPEISKIIDEITGIKSDKPKEKPD